jgi:hypothetical protein
MRVVLHAGVRHLGRARQRRSSPGMARGAGSAGRRAASRYSGAGGPEWVGGSTMGPRRHSEHEGRSAGVTARPSTRSSARAAAAKGVRWAERVRATVWA